MPVPDFQTIMLPLLRLAADGAEHAISDTADQLAAELGLSQAERQEHLPSGRQPRFTNRVGWARTYMLKAGLLESPRRGVFRITQRGRDVLSERPGHINIALLSRFPEFREFRMLQQPDNGPGDGKVIVVEQTPEEQLESSYLQIRRSLAQELLDRVKRIHPAAFEQLVVDLLVAMGYGGSRRDAGRAIGRTGDGGIDGVINEDVLGLDVVYVQAKRWENSIGRPLVQAFAGSLEGRHARKGVMITTSSFTPDARDYVGMIEKKIVLIDGDRLADLMIEHEVGVAESTRYSLKKIDVDYFDEQ